MASWLLGDCVPLDESRGVFLGRTAKVDRLLSDPRRQSETEWLETLDTLVEVLAHSTSCHVHLGEYWCWDDPGSQTASIVGRVRSRSPLPGVSSDYWEAALGYTGGPERTYATASIFPFLDGRPVTSAGRLEPGIELDELRLWTFNNDRFEDCGWTYPDGPGEWGWIEQPGDEYWETLSVTLNSGTVELGKPIVTAIQGATVPDAHRSLKESQGRISLIHANRNRENTNLYPWGARPPRPSCQRAIPIQNATVRDSSISVELSQFRIRGGWIPGSYYIALRLQNCQADADWILSSMISKPFRLTIE